MWAVNAVCGAALRSDRSGREPRSCGCSKRQEISIVDAELSKYMAEKELNLSASSDLNSSVVGAKLIVATPTNYDEKQTFDTSSVEAVIAKVIQYEPRHHRCEVNNPCRVY